MGERKVVRVGAVVGMALAVAGCEHQGKVQLALDFSARPQWCYRMTVDVEVGSGRDTAGRGTSSARCEFCLRPEATEPGVVVVTFEALEILSEVLHPAEVAHARWRLTDRPVRFTMRDGVLTPLDTVMLSEMQFGGWDLYRVIARSVPALPATPVAIGQRWDREYDILLADALAPAVGHLYQTYRLDSVLAQARGSRLAHLSWSYTYRVESTGVGIAFPPQIAAGGRGGGSAVLDVTARALRSAQVSFRVPGDDQARPLWSERVEIELME